MADVSRSGDTVTVDPNVTGSQGGSVNIGAVAGAAAASQAPGNQIAFAAGSAVAFRTTQAVSVQKSVAVQSSGAAS